MLNEEAIVPRPRRLRCRTLWCAGVLLLAMLASGCQRGDGHAMQVLGSAPGSTETTQPSPESTPGGPGPLPISSPDPGDSEQRPGTDGPVGDTGGSGSVGVGPGEGDQPGGLRLLAPPPPFEAVANEIYDMCDDRDAFVAVFGRALDPGEKMTDDELHAIALDRVISEVSCDEPGGRRYVYMSDVGPSGAFATEQAAVDDHNDRNAGSDEHLTMHPQDIPLGYFGGLDWSFPLEDVDEVVLVEDSVLVRDGTIRGLVWNASKTLFAREVTVTARSADNSGAPPASGRFPLTVQPGERAFFEIEGWTGSRDPALIDFKVSAKLSTKVDITRAFSFGTGGTVTTTVLDEEFLRNFVPDFVYQAEKHKIGDDGLLMIEYIDVDLTAPTSHPSLKDQVLNQEIQDLRVYMALTGNGKVYDIREPPLYRGLTEPVHPWDYPPVISQPTIINGHPFYGFHITFIPEYTWHIWVGEPGPLDYNPRTLADVLPEIPATPTVDPDWQPTPPPTPIE